MKSNLKMTKAWAIIKYLQKKDMIPTEIHENMVQIVAEDSSSYAIMKKWAVNFKRGWDRINDDPRSGHPKTSITDEPVDAIHRMVLDEKRLTVQQIAKSIGISAGSVHTGLTEIFGMNKLSAKWVPRIPSPLLKRVDISKTLLTCL